MNLASGIISLFIIPVLRYKLNILYFITTCICDLGLLIYALCDTVINSDVLVYIFTCVYLIGF